MNATYRLFGISARWISIISWIAILLAASQVILTIGFLVISIASGSDDVLGIWFDDRNIQAISNSFIVASIMSFLLTFFSALMSISFKWVNLTGNPVIYSASIIPILIPDHVYGIVGRVIFDPSIGILAMFVPPTLLLDRFSALILIAFVACFKWLPLMTVIADSSILSLGKFTLYQADIDFNSFFSSVKTVFLPNMKQMLILIFCLSFLIGFRQHELAYELTSSGGGFVAEMWSNWNYRVMFEFGNIVFAATEAILTLMLLIIPIVVIQEGLKWF